VLVETIGTGQSETMVADMTDCFLVLMLPGAGAEMQGLKKRVVELADLIAVNQADGDNVMRGRPAVEAMVLGRGQRWTFHAFICFVVVEPVLAGLE